MSAQLLDKLDELGHRRQHHRDVRDRQRRRGTELAGRRHDAVPRREGHQLGRRLARALRDPLAGRHQAGHGVQRDLLAPGHAAHPARGSGGEPDIVEKLQEGVHRPATRPSRSISTGSTCSPIWKGEVKENPRPGFLYWSDEGDLMAIRYGDWKIHFMEQRGEGFLAWTPPWTTRSASPSDPRRSTKFRWTGVSAGREARFPQVSGRLCRDRNDVERNLIGSATRSSRSTSCWSTRRPARNTASRTMSIQAAAWAARRRCS